MFLYKLRSEIALLLRRQLGYLLNQRKMKLEEGGGGGEEEEEGGGGMKKEKRCLKQEKKKSFILYMELFFMLPVYQNILVVHLIHFFKVVY